MMSIRDKSESDALVWCRSLWMLTQFEVLKLRSLFLSVGIAKVPIVALIIKLTFKSYNVCDVDLKLTTVILLDDLPMIFRWGSSMSRFIDEKVYQCGGSSMRRSSPYHCALSLQMNRLMEFNRLFNCLVCSTSWYTISLIVSCLRS